MGDRLQKVLSQRGVASRRKAEQLILEGRVLLNGAPATLGQRADPDVDTIEVDGTLISSGDRPLPVYVLLNKPLGVISTCHDPQRRKTVLDCLPVTMHLHQHLYPVGRLDADSTGALLLTNDGDLAFRLTHPRHHTAKTYEVWVEGYPSEDTLDQWRRGILLDGKRTLPAEVECLRSRSNQSLLKIVLKEGRNRQIRRVAEALHHPVIRLHRTAIGLIQLGSLKPGQYRFLTQAEITSNL